MASDNTALGSEAMTSATSGSLNTAVGTLALLDNISGGFGTAIGRLALQLTIGGNNNGLGCEAGVPAMASPRADGNTFIGRQLRRQHEGPNVSNVVSLGESGDTNGGELSDNRCVYRPNIRSVHTTGFSAGMPESVTMRLSDGQLGHTVLSATLQRETLNRWIDASEANPNS